MPEPIRQWEGQYPSTVIVQVPPEWKQNIHGSLFAIKYPLRLEFREVTCLPDAHVIRRGDLQAEQALAFAARAAHGCGGTGYAIVCDDISDRACVMMAVHDTDRTELQRWHQPTAAQTVTWLSKLLGSTGISIPAPRPEERHSRWVSERTALIDETGQTSPVWWLTDEGRFTPAESTGNSGILSGSFHPLHLGHRKLRKAAERILGHAVHYEMTLQNADKPPLDWLTLRLRSQQFSPGELLLTSVPTFGEKAEVLPGTTFVIGWDTAIRVLDRRFYPAGELESSLEQIAERECRFLVAARRDEKQLRTLEELTIPDSFRDLFAAIPPDLFEEEISSTSIREAWLKGESETGPPGLFSSGMIEY